MDYLLLLQGLREAVPEVINKFILFGSEMMGGIVAIMLMALVYWCLDKKAGNFHAPDPWKCFFFDHGYMEKCERELAPYMNLTRMTEQ